jgi:hypothetical protein
MYSIRKKDSQEIKNMLYLLFYGDFYDVEGKHSKTQWIQF